MSKAKKINALRRDYIFKELKDSLVSKDPFVQFGKWFSDALNENIKDANAMYLATSTAKGKPSVRTVLLKAFDKNGFVFFTNYESKKGNDLNENPFAAILFFWNEMERQIRIEGKVMKVTRKESEEYFHSRPYDSQIAASVSNQSKVIKSRSLLDSKFAKLKNEYSGGEVAVPGNWGGYRVIPYKFEFWQGRQNRLHDRIQFVKRGSRWMKERLEP